LVRIAYILGIDLFVEHYGALIQASQAERHQLELSIHTHIQRIEADDQGLAIKLYPFTRSHEENNPRIVVVDPRIAFGRLTIDGTGGNAEFGQNSTLRLKAFFCMTCKQPS
jgi:hypothetical protein